MTIRADLTEKRALVTGASSDGFGRFFVRVLAHNGAEVCATARRVDPLTALASELTDEGCKVSAAPLDVTSVASVGALMKERGPFDIIVNNAGVSVSKPVIEQTDEDYERVMAVNLKGVWNVSVEAAKSLIAARKPGSIINIASITGLRQVHRITPYAVSKAAVIQLTKQMALELAGNDIRVNAIAPGYFESDLTRSFFQTDRGKALIERIPMRRLGDYESLVGPLLMLASDSSSFMTGAVLAIDGGHLLSSL